MLTWNPNTPHTIGLELPNQGTSFRKIAGLQQMLLTFKSLATENVAAVQVPVGPGTVATSLTVPRKPRFSQAVPDYASLPMNSVDGVVCADIGYPGQIIYTNEYAASSIGAVMNSGQDHRYARNDNIIDSDNFGTGLVSDVQVEGDGNYLSDPNSAWNVGSSSFTFDSGAFPSGRHVLAVEFIIRASGPIMVTIANNEAVPSFWRTSPGRMFYDTREFENHIYRVGEAFVDNRTGTNEIWRLTPIAFVRGFAVGGTRRLIISTDAAPLADPLVRTRIDYIGMRVYSTDETRQATGWMTKNGSATVRVPSDVRASNDTGAFPAPYQKTLNSTQHLLLRQFFPGNIPMPSMVLSTARIYGSAPFSSDWVTRDTIGHPQTHGPMFPLQEPESVISSAVFYPSIAGGNVVTAESQPYTSTGGIFTYSGSENTEKPITKNFPTGITTDLAYVLISDSLGPKNNITFTLGNQQTAGGTTTSVTMTPAEIASFPIVQHSIVYGSGNYGPSKPWELEPTVIRWRRVRVKFPATITFGAGGGRLDIKSLPNEISRTGFTQNYLVGALFPETAGGLYATQLISGDYDVPVVATDGVTNYLPSASGGYADLQATFSTNPPLPVVTASVVTPPGEQSNNQIAWTWAAGGGLAAKRFEVERFDTISGEYKRVLEKTVAGTYQDYEARFNTASTYRVRAVRLDDAESAWVLSLPVTPTIGECTLVLTSNVDPTINSSYVDTYSDSTTHTFSYRDAGGVEYRAIYGKEYEAAFRRSPSGGVEFTRNILLPTGSTNRPVQSVNKDLLALTRNSKIPYVCVMDSDSNRWFASVTQGSLLTTRAIGCNPPIAVASLNIVEVAKDPVIP